jgi:hypothetical protein
MVIAIRGISPPAIPESEPLQARTTHKMTAKMRRFEE